MAINPVRKQLRRHIIHFIRVFNMGVKRSVFKDTDRAYYSLSVERAFTPMLHTDSDLRLWAGNIAAGEAARTLAGGTAMAMPSAAEVAVYLAAFLPLKGQLSNRKDDYDREQEDVERLRKSIDTLIADIWAEVLFFYRKDTPPSVRRKARLWGVIYRPSKKGEVMEEE